ncbi:MAG: hypothetical protein GXO77_15005 [Calditrichaeota bacterium]|nr:hypothetical protein [Calditrichota bacterium]
MSKFKIFLLYFLANLSLVFAGEWAQIQGEYARIEYDSSYFELAQKLLVIADHEIPRLAKLHGLDEKAIEQLPEARIILTEQPDISNGYAMGKSVVIYALSSMYMSFWSEQYSWYRIVLTHELTHWVTFQATRRKLSILGNITGITIPRWFYEGIAQYFAETWNTFRGDLYLKHALLYGNLNYRSLGNLANGRLLYASANAFIRYLAAQYGDSSLVRLIRYKPNALYYDFKKAFKGVYGKTPEELFPEFIRSSVLYYGDYLSEMPVAGFPKPLPSFIERPLQMFKLSESDSLYLVAGKEKSIYKFYSLLVIDNRGKQAKILKRLTDNLATDAVLSPDRRYVAFGTPYISPENDQIALRFKWRILDLKTGVVTILPRPLRSRYGAFDYDNRLYLVEIRADGSDIHRFSADGKSEYSWFSSNAAIGDITFSPENLLVMESEFEGDRDFVLLRNGAPKRLKREGDQRFPLFLNDSLLIFNELRLNQPIVGIFNVQKDSVLSCWLDQYGYWLSSVDSANNSFVAYRYGSDGKRHFFEIPVDSILQFSPKLNLPKLNHYGLWQKNQPITRDTLLASSEKKSAIKPQPRRFPFFPMEHLASWAIPFYDQKFGWGAYGVTLWMEILQRQALAAGFWLTPQNKDNSLIFLNHYLKIFNFDLSTMYYHGPVIFAYQNGKWIQLIHDQINISLHRPFFIGGNNRWRLGATLNYGYFDNHFSEKQPMFPKSFRFQGPSLALKFHYRLPTSYGYALPKRLLSFESRYFKTVSSDYAFNIFQSDLTAAGNIIKEELGIFQRFSFIKQNGTLPPLQTVGIDRFYELDFPRDYTFTRTIRGFREDLSSDQLLWSSTELRYFLKKSTPYKLIFIPIQNVVLDLFFDYASLGSKNPVQVTAHGMQISFGDQFLRFAAGYARAFKEKKFYGESVYLRMSLLLNE